jgi:hypothetical protein
MACRPRALYCGPLGAQMLVVVRPGHYDDPIDVNVLREVEL